MNALSLFVSIIPIYALILVGFFSTSVLKCSKESVAKILLYILSPMVIFNAAMKIEFNANIIFIPVVIYSVSILMSCFTYPFLKFFFKDNRANLLSFSTSAGNLGFLGIPLAMIILDENLLEVFIFSTIAPVLYQYTWGYFMASKGTYSLKQSLIKFIKLPVLHAFLLGLYLNFLGLSLPNFLENIFANAKGALIILGMMMIGMGMEKFKEARAFDFKFLSTALFLKICIHPLIMCLFIAFDTSYLHFFDAKYYLIFFIAAIVSMGGNSIVITQILKISPEKMAFAVLVSNFASLFSIPLMMNFWAIFSTFML